MTKTDAFELLTLIFLSLACLFVVAVAGAVVWCQPSLP